MIYCLFSTFSLHSDGILLDPDTTLAYVFYFSFPMSSFDLKQASKMLANLEQSPTDPRLKRLTFNTSLVCQNFIENVGLNIQGFTCSQGCYVLPTAVGVPREDIMSLMMQMCWVVFVLFEKDNDVITIYFVLDDNLVSTFTIISPNGEAKRGSGEQVDYLEFQHPYDINQAFKRKASPRFWDVPVSLLTDPAEQDQPIYVSAKIYTLDPRVDDTYVHKFIAEFIVRKDRLPWLFTPQPVFSIYQIG